MDLAPINPSDLLLIAGHYGYRPTLPTILGAEGVGTIVAVGARVDAGRIGEQVLVLPTLIDTTWREQTVTDATTAIAVDGDPAQLAMLGINPMTTWGMLHGFTDLEPGADVVLVDGPDIAAKVRQALGRDTIDLLIDGVGGPTTTALAPRMSMGGTIISYTSRGIISYTSRGAQPIRIDIGDLIFGGLVVRGFWLDVDAAPTHATRRDRTGTVLVAIGDHK